MSTHTHKYVCTLCDNIYEEAELPDLNCGCKQFECLPDDWRCPSCGNDKDKYQPCACVSVDSTQPVEAR
jgi:rubredoxin